jgi:excisionase family DNA binding protein
MPEGAADKFMNVTECARMLKLSSRYFYDLLRNGEGPRFKRFGNRIRIRYSDLMKWATPAKTKGH